jgi:hypothetical protein
MIYNTTVPAITPSYSGFVNNEGASVLSPGPSCTSTAPSSGAVGTYTTSCTGAVDANYSIGYVTGTLTIGKAGTRTTLSAAPSPSTQGQAATITATIAITAPGAGAPTGTVTFYDGATSLGPGSLSTRNGVTTATYSTSSLALGPHTLTAGYAGDGNFLSSTAGPLTQYVNTKLSGYPTLPNGAYNLSNANLSGGYFVDASLAGASLTGANLTNATFISATLTGANLSNSNFMSSANFTNATLQNANLSNSNLKGANFTGVNLTGANFTGVNLTGANFSNSILTGATGLKTATLTNVVWSKTTCPDGTLSTTDGGTCVGHL